MEIPDTLAEDSLDHVELTSQAGSSWFDDLRIVEGSGAPDGTHNATHNDLDGDGDGDTNISYPKR